MLNSAQLKNALGLAEMTLADPDATPEQRELAERLKRDATNQLIRQPVASKKTPAAKPSSQASSGSPAADRLAVEAKKPLRGKKPQKDADKGLFDTGARVEMKAHLCNIINYTVKSDPSRLLSA